MPTVKIIEYRQLIHIVTMFLIVQFLGMLVFMNSISGQSILIQHNIPNTPSIATYAEYLIIEVIILILIFAVIFRKFNERTIAMMLKALETVYLFFGATVIVYIFTNSIFSLLAGIALVLMKKYAPYTRNIATIISTAGIGVYIGSTLVFISNGFYIIMVLFVILAVYDFISVFITKHMVAIANVASKGNLSLLIGSTDLAAVPKAMLNPEQSKIYTKEYAEVINKNPVLKKLYKEGMAPLYSVVMLGQGDLLLPLVVSISSFTVDANFTLGLFIILGATIGIIATMFILKRYKRPLPALPPLLGGILIGLFLYQLYMFV